MNDRERGYNEFRVKVSRDHPAIFQDPILCDSCNKWIESEMITITYYEDMDGVIDTQRAICDDCFEKYEYYQELDETTPEQFNEAYHRRPAYPSVYGRFCLNCGYKLDFDKYGMRYRATCQNCNWRNKLGVDYKDPDTPFYELITLKRERLKDGFIQIAYPNIPKKFFKRLPRDLRNALMHHFEEPETLRKKEYDLIDSKIVSKTRKEIWKKIKY